MDTNNLQLKKFEVVGSKFSRKISISRAYSFGFPPTFISENNLAGNTFVTLYYDADRKVIGFQFTREGHERSSFKISFNKKSGGASFGARSFFAAHKLNPDVVRGRYDYEKKDISGVGEVFLIKIQEHQDSSLEE